jgi:hypothetical protein
MWILLFGVNAMDRFLQNAGFKSGGGYNTYVLCGLLITRVKSLSPDDVWLVHENRLPYIFKYPAEITLDGLSNIIDRLTHDSELV